MRRLQFWLLLMVIGFLLAIWSPWNNWSFSITQLFGVAPAPESAGLQVISLAGEIEVYLDNDLKGVASAEPQQAFLLPGISPGEHQVKLVRKSEVSGAFIEFNRLLNFISGADVVISYELGPTEDFSEGHVISVGRNIDFSGDTYLNINSVPEQAKVLVDGISVGETPLVLFPIDLNSQLQINLIKEGFEPQSFTILPEEQSARDKLKGFTLDIDARLFLQPIRISQ